MMNSTLPAAKQVPPTPRMRRTKGNRLLALAIVFTLGVANALAVPVILNSTESAGPGEVISLQGDNFTTTPQVWFRRVLTTDTSLTPDTQLSPVLSKSNQAVTATLPLNMPLGLYALWVKDSGGTLSAPVFINRARATSFEFTEIAPYSASNPASSYTFRIFGRNLMLKGSTPVVTLVNGANSYAATVDTSYANDAYVLRVKAPAGITPGTAYTVKVSNGSGHSTANYDITTALPTILGRTGGADPFGLGVPWGADFVNIAADVINVVSSINPHTGAAYGADATGAANSVNAIQQALYDAANTAYHPNGATVYLPAGTYLINWTGENTTFYGPSGTIINQATVGTSSHNELNIPGRVVLKGAGIGQTIINDASPAYNGYSFFIALAPFAPNNGNLSGVKGFTYNQTMTVSAGNYPPIIRNYATNSSKMFFDNIQVTFAHGVFATTNLVYGSFIPQSANNTNVLVQNCNMSYLRFGNSNYYYYNYTYGSNYIFRNNTFSSYFARLAFLYIGNLLIENNHFTRDGAFPPANYGGGTTGGGIESTGDDKVILSNTLDGINLPLPSYNDGESILCQSGPVYGGAGGALGSGTATSATSNTLTDSTKTWTANANAGQLLSITGGTGQGQWAVIGSNTATTLSLDRAWTTLPNSTSTYAFKAANSYVLSTLTGSSSSTAVDSTQSWPTNFHKGDSIAIINGPGTGQLRSIVSNTSNTLTINSPWIVNPTSSSRYSINGATGGSAQRWLVKGNTLKRVPRGIIFYLGGYDCVAANNNLSSAGGIFLFADQRSFSGANPLDRMDISWNNLIADNVVTDPDNNRAAYIANHLAITTNNALFGTTVMGTEIRRNFLQASTPNLMDNAFHCSETLSNAISIPNPGTYPAGMVGVLGSLFTDNVMLNGANSYEVSSGNSQTIIWNSLHTSAADYLDTTLSGAGSGSDQTVVGNTPDGRIFKAGFSGTGTSTGLGGTGSNLLDMGASGQLVQSSGATASIQSASPFVSGSGSYLRVAWSGSNSAGAGLLSSSISPAYSWARIFNQRSGQWQVNGGFDFFLRPSQSYPTNISGAQYMRAIDMGSSGTNSIRMVFYYNGNNQLMFQIITPSGGGGANISGTYPAGFVAGNVYHIGVTLSSDISTSPAVTTARIFVLPGTGAIDTTSATNKIGTGTFALNHSIVNDSTPTTWFNGGDWSFGNGYSVAGTAITNEYDGLKLYYNDPGLFPALNTP